MSIKPYSHYTKKAFSDLKKIQDGDKLLPKTGFDFIDSHLGCLLPSDCILISSPSGTGKTTVAQKIKENILNTDINPNALNYVFLDYSLEMKVFNLIMRASSQLLGKKKSEVLFNNFTEEEQKIIKEYYNDLNDDSKFISQTPPTPEQFNKECSEFLETHKDKDAVFICIDHLLLLSGTDKQKLLEKLCEYINQIKLKYENVYFLLISQSNREIYGRAAEKNNRSAPMPLDVFGSSFMDQLCAFNIFLYNPYRLGIENYMKVNPARYEYLEDYFTEEDSKGKVSFLAEGLIFAHCLKVRESDDVYKDIYVIDTGQREKKQEPKQKELFKTPVFSTDKTEDIEFDSPVPVNFDMNAAFGEPDNTSLEEDDEVPF